MLCSAVQLDDMSWSCRLDDGTLSVCYENWMKSYFQFGVVFGVIALSICAFAGSVSDLDGSRDLGRMPNNKNNVESFKYSTPLTGVPNSTLQATFTYNTKTDTFTKETLNFVGGFFDGLSITITKAQHGDTFVFNKKVNGDTIAYTIVFNELAGTFEANGSITKGKHEGYFQYDMMAPEGGNQLSYLAASGLVLFAGILLAGKQSRRRAENYQKYN